MKKLFVAALGLSFLLSGCACCPAGREDLPTKPQKILAVGYGAIGANNTQLTVGQQKLMAMRAARVDAYRNLAEQVFGFRVWGNTAVSAFAAQSDNVRSYVDAYIRGARLVNMVPVQDGNFEATIELELTPTFFACVASTEHASASAPASACGTVAATRQETGCSVSGCVQPSNHYFTNL